jgi:hypothetical protein
MGGVDNYVDNFDNYPRKCCGNIRKKYIFDDLLNIITNPWNYE